METPPDASFDLHLPAGTATLFEQRVAMIPEDKRNSWRYHPVVAGDTLDSVAREYHVATAELAGANQLNADESLAGVEALVVPVPPQAEPSAHMRLYTVRRGDTLVTIADRFGISLEQLRRWNRIPSGIRVEVGRHLHVAEPVLRRASASTRRRTSTSNTREQASTSHSAQRREADPPPHRRASAQSSTSRRSASSAGKSAASHSAHKSATHAHTSASQ